MAEKPAPLDVVRQKLDSRNETARVVALLHAEAHGGAARALAARVAAMLEDESPSVQLHAVGTFRSIGGGAADAVPVLLSLLAKGGPPMLVHRATHCLGYIGSAARDAVPALKWALRQDGIDAHGRRSALEALWKLAPDDGEVLDSVLAEAFSSDIWRFLGAHDILKQADDPVIDRAFAEIAARTRSSDPDGRTAAARLLALLGDKRPEAAADLLGELLRDPAAPEAWPAVGAVGLLPAPRPPALIDAVIRVAGGDDGAALHALQVLAELGPEASRAQDTFLGAIGRNLGADPVPGPAGWPALSLAAAARGLAQACPTDRAVEPLLTWLHRVAGPTGSAQGQPSWSPIGHVIEALAQLSPHATAVHDAILGAVARAQACIDDDESGVLDFHRSVRRAFEHLPNAEEMFARAETLGMPRIDPYAREDEPEGVDHAAMLPDFPAEDEPEPVATLAQLDEGVLEEIAALIVRGRTLLGLEGEPDPPVVAAAVERWLGRLRRRETEATQEDHVAVGVAYGDAVRVVTGWQWRFYMWKGSHYLALASGDSTFVHLPVAYMARQVAPSTETTALLLFNMFAAGAWPDAKLGGLTVIG